MFVDQSGFYLLPTVVRTYALVGQTPILHEKLTRDHLSAMSGITLEGKLLMLEQERAFNGKDVVHFLKHALGQIPGKLLIVWDGSSIHRSKAVKEFLEEVERPSVFGSNSCPVTHQNSTPTKVYGST